MRSSELQRQKAMKRRNAERRDAEFRRCYGSAKRVRFVQRHWPCAACGKYPRGYENENAHIEREGMGRKAGYKRIVSLCPAHHTGPHGLDTIGRQAFEVRYGVDLDAEAERLELAWSEAKDGRFYEITDELEY